jgi:hypothetical protein
VGYTSLTGVGVFCGSFLVLPAGTGLTDGAHRPERCRSVVLELVFRCVLESVKVIVGSYDQ